MAAHPCISEMWIYDIYYCSSKISCYGDDIIRCFPDGCLPSIDLQAGRYRQRRPLDCHGSYNKHFVTRSIGSASSTRPGVSLRPPTSHLSLRSPKPTWAILEMKKSCPLAKIPYFY
jgi:hypothetical protein